MRLALWYRFILEYEYSFRFLSRRARRGLSFTVEPGMSVVTASVAGRAQHSDIEKDPLVFETLPATL